MAAGSVPSQKGLGQRQGRAAICCLGGRPRETALPSPAGPGPSRLIGPCSRAPRSSLWNVSLCRGSDVAPMSLLRDSSLCRRTSDLSQRAWVLPLVFLRASCVLLRGFPSFFWVRFPSVESRGWGGGLFSTSRAEGQDSDLFPEKQQEGLGEESSQAAGAERRRRGPPGADTEQGSGSQAQVWRQELPLCACPVLSVPSSTPASCSPS